MIVAYADPPYPGVAHRYPEKAEVDHVELLGRLQRDFPEGWALSTKSNALRDLLPLCPKARVAAWVEPFASALANVRPVYAWEPIIFQGGRRHREPLVLDWVLTNPSVSGYAVLGEKPAMFCYWLFQVLGLRPGDTLIDLFPGSGNVARAWEAFCRQLPLPLEEQLA